MYWNSEFSLFLGPRDLETWGGELWDIVSYEDYIIRASGTTAGIGIRLKTSFYVCEPCFGTDDSDYSKLDMQEQKIPVAIITNRDDLFTFAEAHAASKRFPEDFKPIFMGDPATTLLDLPEIESMEFTLAYATG